MVAKTLKMAAIGEPDANAEYFLARKEKKNPIFIDAYYDDQSSDMSEFNTGSKFILYGQKGTGKTALLRHLEKSSLSDYKTKFVIFRKEILEEAELSSMAVADGVSLVVDEEQIKRTHFYQHAMKRLLLTLLLTECNDLETAPENISWFSKIYEGIKTSSTGEIASLVIDSIVSAVGSVKIDVNSATKSLASIDASKAIKRSNDAFTKYCFQQFKKKNLKARIFLDEMHFAYRDKTTLGADAALVRDTIIAVQNINEKLIEDEIDSCIFISVRSEFLEHAEIATADIAHTIQSYGKEISWESHIYNRSHPIFDLMASRLRLSFGADFSKKNLLTRFFPGQRHTDFLNYSWGKPRDIVRYFKAAKESYPNNYKLSDTEVSSVLRKYSNSAWQDMRSALTAFVPKDSITHLESCIAVMAKRAFEQGQKYSLSSALLELEPAHKKMQEEGVKYEVSELFRLLYIIGIFFITYTDSSGATIMHQFHRGNRRPVDKGNVNLHFAVAKAFS